ncbi:MAG: hypothetical protein OEZ43_14055 [Gammaproteobacteria bacterium]|nr:hypothetical protein [Gammaproteobacteria bacterium]
MYKTLLLLVLVIASVQNAFAVAVSHFGPYDVKITTAKKADKFGNKYFGSNYETGFDISYAQQAGIPYAFHAGTNNFVNVKVLKDWSVANVSGKAAVNIFSPTALAHYDYNVQILSKTYWSANKDILSGSDWSTKDALGKETQVLWTQTTTSIPIPLGPIPFNIQAGLRGEAGAKGSLNFKQLASSQLTFNYGPYAKLDAIVNGNVSLAFARGGIYGWLTLLGIEQNMAASALVNVTGATLSAGLPGQVNSLKGEIGVFGDVKNVKLCSKWGIKYPCGTYWTTIYKATMISFGGIVQKWNLKQYSQSFGAA